MATKTVGIERPAGDGYLALVRKFPLRPIRTEAELDGAIAMVDTLSDRKNLADDEHDYLLVLSSLIEKYEDDHYPIPEVSGLPMLRSLLEFKGVTQAQVAAQTGIAESTLSEILAGKRRMATKHIAILAKYFGVDPGLLLPD
jgi:HTH-type transcriptional regulator / antitoxin HigA